MATADNVQISGLARCLVADGLIDEEGASDATAKAQADKVPFVSYVVSKGIVQAKDIATSAANEFGVPIIDLDAFDMESIPRDLVTEKLIKQHAALPLVRRGMRLYVALTDPTNQEALDEIKFNAGVNTEAVLVEEDKLQALIERFLSQSEDDGLGGLDDDELEDVDLEAIDEDGPAQEEDIGSAGDDTPIVRFVNKMLLDAIKISASDLHFEPYEKTYRVRFRHDGILKEIAKPPVNLGGRLAARLKVMSQLDISERRKPQDGRIKMKLSKNKAIDFRVNTLPTIFGEKVVLRILDPSSAQLGIDALGYEPEQKENYMEALHKPQGMILVTGPTGSGKTVSLYTGLNILNTAERNISTAEDPVEINLEGINQVPVNPKVGLTFAEALRSFLRQDPDIIMVGEIRDLETAEIAIKAAQTGHMVMSTLHTDSAAETLTRLRNMGVPAFNIATSVSLIIAQRLARRLCDCKVPVDVPKDALIEMGFPEDDCDFEVMGPGGCENAATAGYKGRTGVYEVVKITEPMSRIIMEDGNSIEIRDVQIAEGFDDLRASGLRKIRDGVTSIEEINRVTTN